MSLHLKFKGVPLDERGKSLSKHFPNTDIALRISTMDKNDLARMKRKFEVAYFVAKQQLPITK